MLPEDLAGRGLHKLADCLFAHPRWFSYPQLVLGLACIVYTVTTLQFSTDRSDLVSSQVRYRRNFLELKKEFRLPDNLVVVVESESPDKNRRFVERLAARLQNETNLITRAYFKSDLKLMGPKALLFLPEEVLARLDQVLQTNRALINAFSRATNLNAQFELVNRQFDRRRAAPVAPGSEHPLARAVPTLQLKESFQKAAGYAVGIVAALVFLHFRRIDAMALALLPLLLGYGWMLGRKGWTLTGSKARSGLDNGEHHG